MEAAMTMSAKDKVVASVVQTISIACSPIPEKSTDAGADTTLSICRLYDELLRIASDSPRPLEVGILGLRLLTETKTIQEVAHVIGTEADFYRTAILISLFLQLNLPENMTSARDHAEITLQRASFLLGVLESIYSNFLGRDENPSPILPTSYPDLENTINQLKEDIGSSESNILSFDREQLEADESELLRMANTPTPTEKQTDYQCIPHAHTPLVARLKTTESGSFAVELDELGIIRRCQYGAAATLNRWWALTSKSSVTMQSPKVTIACVTTNSPELETTSVTLDVGRDGYIWWERVTKIVNQLKDVKELQDQAATHWSQEDYQEARSRAHNDMCREQLS
jgi:hypothetical protein